MQLMKQFSVNEAKYSIVLETIALGERDQHPWRVMLHRASCRAPGKEMLIWT